MSFGTHVTSWIDDVNGAAIDASADDIDIPMWAVFKAFEATGKREIMIFIEYEIYDQRWQHWGFGSSIMMILQLVAAPAQEFPSSLQVLRVSISGAY